MNNAALLGGTPVRTDPWPAYPVFGKNVEDAVLRALHSNCLHPMFGKETQLFEQEFAAYHGVEEAAAFAHGTLAIQAAMAAAGIGCGDEVIVPAYTYAASAGAAVDQNAIPVFADVEPNAQGLDPVELRKKITPRTKAVVVVHANGYPADMDAIMAIAEEHNLIVIEDCSHAHGAEHRGRKVGTIGHFGAFSLQHKKNFAAGIGGITITRDKAMAEEMRKIRNYEWHPVGHNWQTSELHSAISRVVLTELDENNDIRRANAAMLIEELDGIPGISTLPGLPDTRPVFYNVMVQLDEEAFGLPRNTVVDALKAEGIPINMFYVPLQRWPIFADHNFFGKGCPFSCPLHEGGPVDYQNVSTPMAARACDHSNIEIKIQPPCGETEMKQIAAAFRKIYDHRNELKGVE
jgi:dTDP-4-amino-4,6-dideoxygalactose transaminase